jgi:hypothetical protein
MRRPGAIVCAALFALLSCGGGTSESSTASTAPEPSPEQKLLAAQESAIEAMCERLVDCAVAEARETMSPDEVAKLDVDKRARLLRDDCEAEGAQSRLSPRQIRVVQRCVNQESSCAEFETCLQEAKKRD